MRLLFSFLFALGLLAAHAQPNTPYPASSLAVRWEVVENGYNGGAHFLSAFTLTNEARVPLPASGWSVFFNFPRTIQPASVGGGLQVTHINGDFYRLAPGTGFRGLPPGDSLRVPFVSAAWAVSRSDAPAGLYLVWDASPAKGWPLDRYTLVPPTHPRQYMRTAADKVERTTPQQVYAENSRILPVAETDLPRIFPKPVVYQETGAELVIGNFRVETDAASLRPEAQYLEAELGKLLGKTRSGPVRRLRLQLTGGGSDAYRLQVDSAGIVLTAGSRRGIFYGIQSIKSLVPPAAYRGGGAVLRLPGVAVVDSPRFAHRAFMLDVARHFQPRKEILKVLDLMALYKLNVLHFHFSDDEGWRLQIPGLPELTEVGARRAHALTDDRFLHPSFGSGPDANNTGSGYYTTADFIEILRYAAARHIEVIPEIEAPGHARAAVAAMNARYRRLRQAGQPEAAGRYLLYHPDDTSRYRSVQGWHRNVMDVSLPSTYRFLEKVVDELRGLYAKAGAPLHRIHFGGDEVPAGVWAGSPAARQLIRARKELETPQDLWYYFYDSLYTMLRKKGLGLYGWEEMALRFTSLDGKPYLLPNPGLAGRDVQTDVWNNVIGWGAEDLPYRLANAGYRVILSPVSNLYFDMAYQKDFDEPGYYWGGYLDVDKPFRFIPLDYYRNATHDLNGNRLPPGYFSTKERLTDYGKTNIPGLQGLLWSENVKSPEDLEYLLLPKLLAMAERAWVPDPAWAQELDSARTEAAYQQDWSRFVQVLGRRELPRLDHYAGGFRYRIPTPGVRPEGGAWVANSQFPGLILRYTTDGSEPTASSPVYEGPVRAAGAVRFRLFSANGRGGRTVTMNRAL